MDHFGEKPGRQPRRGQFEGSGEHGRKRPSASTISRGVSSRTAGEVTPRAFTPPAGPDARARFPGAHPPPWSSVVLNKTLYRASSDAEVLCATFSRPCWS